MLLSVKKAYENGAFDGDVTCPIPYDLIEVYIQILLPAYQFTLSLEGSNSSIADVIPGVLRLINVWDKMKIENLEARELCFFLIHFLKLKFKYELESSIYQVLKLKF